MKTLTPLLLIVVNLLAAACDDARAHAPQARPARYFGEEFAQAHRDLASRPMAEMPQAF